MTGSEIDLRIATATALRELHGTTSQLSDSVLLADAVLEALAHRIRAGDAVQIPHLGTLEIIPSPHGSAIALRVRPARELLEVPA